MRGWVLAFGCLVALSGVAQVIADEPSDASIELRVARGTFVSTDETLGVLHIVNRSGSGIYLGPVAYVITHRRGDVIDAGSEVWREAPHRMIVVPDGSTFDKALALPRCAPPQRQCSFDVQVKLPIEYQRTSAQAAAQTPVRERTLQSGVAHVEIRADPTATFDLKGLRGNRPLVIIQANARSREMPNVLKLGFFPHMRPISQPDMQKLIADLSASIRAAGIEPQGWETSTEDEQPVIRIDVAPDTPRDRYLPVEAKVNEQFRDRVSPARDQYGVNITSQSDVNRIFWERLYPALHRIFALANLLDPARGNYYDRGRYKTEWGNLVQQEPLIFVSVSSATPVPITYEGSQGFVAAAPRRFVAPKSSSGEFFGNWSPAIRGFGSPLAIANDRLHIYAVGTSDETWSWQRNREPDGVALNNAERRVGRAAKILGVRTGYESLLVRYLSDLSFDEFGIRVLGVAASGDDDTRASWRRARIDRATGASHAAQFGFAPLALTAPNASIRGEAQSEIVVPADGTRLEISIRELDDRDVAVDAHKLGERLRKLPHVRDVAVQSAQYTGSNVAFEVLFDTTARGAIKAVHDRIGAAYHAPREHYTTRMTPVRHDCVSLDANSMRAAFAMATNDALLQASAASVKLERLVLAEAYPLLTQGRECETRARIVEGGPSAPPDPLYVHATMHAALTFRTSAPVH